MRLVTCIGLIFLGNLFCLGQEIHGCWHTNQVPGWSKEFTVEDFFELDSLTLEYEPYGLSHWTGLMLFFIGDSGFQLCVSHYAPPGAGETGESEDLTLTEVQCSEENDLPRYWKYDQKGEDVWIIGHGKGGEQDRLVQGFRIRQSRPDKLTLIKIQPIGSDVPIALDRRLSPDNDTTAPKRRKKWKRKRFLRKARRKEKVQDNSLQELDQARIDSLVKLLPKIDTKERSTLSFLQGDDANYLLNLLPGRAAQLERFQECLDYLDKWAIQGWQLTNRYPQMDSVAPGLRSVTYVEGGDTIRRLCEGRSKLVREDSLLSAIAFLEKTSGIQMSDRPKRLRETLTAEELDHRRRIPEIFGPCGIEIKPNGEMDSSSPDCCLKYLSDGNPLIVPDSFFETAKAWQSWLNGQTND